MKYTFTIGISPANESWIDFEISEKEKELICEAIDEEIEFCDCEELSDLYRRVYEAAKEKLEEDMDLTGDDIDVDDLEYWIEFGDYPE